MLNWDQFSKDRGVASLFGVSMLEQLGPEFKVFWLSPRANGKISLRSAGRTVRSFEANDVEGAAAYLERRGRAGGASRQRGPVFGFKNGWLLVRERDALSVTRALGSAPSRTRLLGKALEKLDQAPRSVVTVPSGDWTLALGRSLMGDGTAVGVRRVVALVRQPNLRFGEAQGFATHRAVDYVHWIRCQRGQVVRVMAYSEGETIVETGRPSKR